MLDYIPQLNSIRFYEAEIQGIELQLLRLDLIHPEISGNKWFKLQENIKEAINANKNTIVTFGGAFSNHIAATAAACKLYGLQSVGIIRGEKNALLNETLATAQQNGMEFYFIGREDYKNKTIPFEINKEHYVIPEGGANELGIQGCEKIITQQLSKFDTICCAVGTGTTAAGILRSLNKKQNLIAFPALKNGTFLRDDILTHVEKIKHTQLKIITDYDFGGYAKVTQELIDFVTEFNSQQSIQLDFIYTAKMFFGVIDLIKKNYFKQGSKLLLIHSGGTQGNKGIKKRYPHFFTDSN